MVKAIGFDLGETLIHYPGIPLSWQSLYEPALKIVAGRCNCMLDDMIYVGNEPKDVLGANSAGMRSVFLDRDGTVATYGEKRKFASLLELIDR